MQLRFDPGAIGIHCTDAEMKVTADLAGGASMFDQLKRFMNVIGLAAYGHRRLFINELCQLLAKHWMVFDQNDPRFFRRFNIHRGAPVGTVQDTIVPPSTPPSIVNSPSMILAR